MTQIYQIAIASVGLAFLSGCATPKTEGLTPEIAVTQINAVKAQASDPSSDATRLEKLNNLLSVAETGIADTGADPALNLAWTFAAMTAADALKSIPGQSDSAFAEAAGKTLNYADKASTSCLSMASSGIDSRQGNFCGMALAVRRLNDSSSAVQAFTTATNAGDWAGSVAASEGFGQQVSTNWAGYNEDAAQLSLSEQNQTPFRRMALQEACELQIAQGEAGLLRNPSTEDDVRGAKDAYWTAMASAATFLGISSSAEACTTDADSRSCKRETEIKLAETCQAL
jgi:inosine/xanthosine triphosphate pyrophosphatase family protein